MTMMTALSSQRAPVRDNKRPQLLDAAAQHFADQGYAAASMRDIAAAAGMKAGSMYYYFPSKEDLLVAVHEEGIHRISAAVVDALTDVAGPWARLEAAMAAHLQALLGGGDYVRVVIKVPPGEQSMARERLIALRDAYERIFTRLIAELPLSSDMSLRHLRLMVLGAMNWTPNWYRSGGDNPREIAASFVRALRQGDCP